MHLALQDRVAVILSLAISARNISQRRLDLFSLPVSFLAVNDW